MTVLLMHAAATWYMVGLIWFVQLVHYPRFGGVGGVEFRAYAAQHQRRTTWVVGPPMLAEAATAAWLLAQPPAGVARGPLVLGGGLLLLIWLSTAAVQVPRHTTLGGGYDARAHRTLVSSNWIRTTAWTARGALVLWLVAHLLD